MAATESASRTSPRRASKLTATPKMEKKMRSKR